MKTGVDRFEREVFNTLLDKHVQGLIKKGSGSYAYATGSLQAICYGMFDKLSPEDKRYYEKFVAKLIDFHSPIEA